MDLAVVISVHNQNNLRLKNCLRTWLYQETSHSYGIYIVDYASDDNLRTMLQELGSDKIFYLSTENDIGKPRANNVAIRAVDADIVCLCEPYCVVPMQTVEFICSGTTDDTLMLYTRRPYYVPEIMWSNPNVGPVDYERLRLGPPAYLAETFQIGIGPSKKILFAAKKERFVEINGFDETLEVDEDVDIVRRFLQRGLVLTDLAQLIDVAYQPSVDDKVVKLTRGIKERNDVFKSEASAALWRNDPIRNTTIEWGQL